MSAWLRGGLFLLLLLVSGLCAYFVFWALHIVLSARLSASECVRIGAVAFGPPVIALGMITPARSLTLSRQRKEVTTKQALASQHTILLLIRLCKWCMLIAGASWAVLYAAWIVVLSQLFRAPVTTVAGSGFVETAGAYAILYGPELIAAILLLFRWPEKVIRGQISAA